MLLDWWLEKDWQHCHSQTHKVDYILKFPNRCNHAIEIKLIPTEQSINIVNLITFTLSISQSFTDSQSKNVNLW